MVLSSLKKKYASELLQKTRMGNCKPVTSPMSTSEKLSSSKGNALVPNDCTRYQSIVGALQYLTLTRPGISFAVNKVCQFLHAPTTILKVHLGPIVGFAI
jgi:hypothetical protein